MLLAEEARWHLGTVRLPDDDLAEDLLREEDPERRVQHRAVADVGQVRLHLVKPLVERVVVAGDAAEAAGAGLGVVVRVGHVLLYEWYSLVMRSSSPQRAIGKVRLEFVRGTSAKQYTVWIERSGEKFEVWASWGRIDDKTPTTALKSKRLLVRADAEALAATLLDTKRRNGYADIGKAKPKTVSETKKPATKVRRITARSCEWGLRFARPATRRAIACLSMQALGWHKTVLDPKADMHVFASQIVGIRAGVRPFLPEGIEIDARVAESTARALSQLKGWSDAMSSRADTMACVVEYCVAFLSHGVKEIRWEYAGGGDGIGVFDEATEYRFFKQPKGGKSGTRERAEQTLASIRKIDGSFDPSILFSELVGATGAGPPEYGEPEYSENLLVNFEKGFFKAYGWVSEDE